MPTSTPTTSPAIPSTLPPSVSMPGEPTLFSEAPENQGQSTEGEEVGSSETVASAGDGEVGGGAGEVEEESEGGSTDGGSSDGSQGGEEIQEEEEEGQFIQEGEGGAGENEGETGSVDESRPAGDVTDPGEEVGEEEEGEEVEGEEVEGEEGSNYLVAAGSAYPCPSPGYFTLTGSCTEFWVCKEVGPGLLSAERPFRCPKRYLFDPITRLCQREAKVECQPSLFYSLASRLAIPLREDQLEAFFSSPLTLASSTSSVSAISKQHPRLPILPSPLPLFSPMHHRPPHVGMFYWLGK